MQRVWFRTDTRARRWRLGVAVMATALLLSGVTPARGTEAQDVDESAALRRQAVDVLRHGLAEPPGSAKVRAARYLLGLDYPQGVADAFEQELADRGDDPGYRVRIWEVLARAAARDEQRGDR